MSPAELLPRSERRARHAASRGFTLVELMVAMTGGLFLSIVVFALSRDASRFYQSESRIANATLSSMAGFERLTGDLSRAGHMSTPNITTDPRVCNRPTAAWPDGIERLRAVAIDTVNQAVGTEVAAAGFTPHRITVSGAFDAPEELYSNTVEQVANGYAISLNLNTPAARRLGLLAAGAGSAANNQGVLAGVFMVGNVGRIVRLRKDGREQYGVVASTATTATTAIVNLLPSPSLQFRIRDDVQCGIDGVGKDFGISVINIVRYDIRSMTSNLTYKSLFDAAKGPFETGRAELVRVEVDYTGAEIASTLEIVAEYAVDLQLSPWAATDASNPNVVASAATNFTDTGGSPQLMRGLHVLLGVRSREADREANVGSGGGTNHYRIPLGPSQGPPFARIRTLQGDIALRNLESASW